MNVRDVREKYLTFFERHQHARIPSSALVPENDPTTLFTGSGMQPLLPYLLGQKHPQGNRLVDSQKCFRAEDIEEVGDNRHTTFFEMLGNWSLGDYFKEEQLTWCFSFLIDELKLDPKYLYVTVFSGDSALGIPKDTESIAIWKKLFSSKGIDAVDAEIGSKENGYARGMKEGERIFHYDAKKNWWSRAGVPALMPAGEPGGPDSEVFFDFQTEHDPSYGNACHPNCDCGRFMEIGNSVFMEYVKLSDGSFETLSQKNVDFGGGLERITAAVNNDADIFNVDVLAGLIEQLQMLSTKKYRDSAYTERFRVIADHIRGAVFMVGDGVIPSNTEQGYFARRLIRRSIVHMDKLGIEPDKTNNLVYEVVRSYRAQYPLLEEKKVEIADTIQAEETRFRETLSRGLKEFEKRKQEGISGEDAFTLFSTYGFPVELTQELAEEAGIAIDMEGYQKEMEKHQQTSRAGADEKFKGGLADTDEVTTQLHSATHLLLAGLRKYLGNDVHQAGSNITKERTRFDFTHPKKVDRETCEKVEAYVNNAIGAKAERKVVQMQKKEAQNAGVEGSFWERYPEVVDVYEFVDDEGVVWSRELCGGPHVENTGDIQGTFKITKEESSSAGVRRIKAILE